MGGIKVGEGKDVPWKRFDAAAGHGWSPDLYASSAAWLDRQEYLYWAQPSDCHACKDSSGNLEREHS